MLRTLFGAVLLGGLAPGTAMAQEPASRPVPTAPGSAAPVWQRAMQLSDGRTFVTDGGLAIDAAIARPATLPADILPAASVGFVERHMSAWKDDEFALSQLSRLNLRAYGTPSGVHLNPTYIDFLRRMLPADQLRLRTGGLRDPVVIVVDGRPAGVFMPLAQ